MPTVFKPQSSLMGQRKMEAFLGEGPTVLTLCLITLLMQLRVCPTRGKKATNVGSSLDVSLQGGWVHKGASWGFESSELAVWWGVYKTVPPHPHIILLFQQPVLQTDGQSCHGFTAITCHCQLNGRLWGDGN